MRKILPGLLYVLILITISYEAFIFYPRWKQQGSEATISWDVSGYYMYLPAFIIYKDPARLGFGREIIDKYHPSEALDQAMLAPNGNYIMKYSSGLSFLYLPFFLIAHLLAPHLGYPADGFSTPYQAAIAIGCVLYGLLALWIMRKVLLQYFDKVTTALTVFVLAMGTNYLIYSSTDAANIHVNVFLLYTAILWFTHQWYKQPRLRYAVAIGFFVGWAALCRPVDIASCLIPLLWNIGTWADARRRPAFFKQHATHLFSAVLVAAMVGSIQLVYWKVYSGHFFYYSYGNETFQWLKTHVYSCLFSYKKGWFVYTPVMVLIIPGFWFLYKSGRRMLLLCLVFFIAYAYVIFSWQTWWYGGGFGQRALIQSYALLVFPLAALMEWLIKSRIWARLPALIFIGGCIWLNLVMLYQAHARGFPWECNDMTGAYYWKIFGKTKVPAEYTLFLDNGEEYTGDTSRSFEIYFNDFEGDYNDYIDTVKALSGKHAVNCTQPRNWYPVFVLPAKSVAGMRWLRLKASFFTTNKQWVSWQMTQWTISFRKNGLPIKQSMVRPERVLNNGEWKQVQWDVSIPVEPIDSVIVMFAGSAQGGPLLMDDLRLQGFK